MTFSGIGKTYASAFAMRESGYKRVLFLAHRGQLARQTKGSYQKVFGKNISMGLVGAGYSDYDSDLYFSMTRKFIEELEVVLLELYELLITRIDEKYERKNAKSTCDF